MNSYYETHKQEILEKMIAEALSLPGGTETTVARLYRRALPNRSESMEAFGLPLWKDFLGAAKEKGIFTDFSKHDGKCEGMPYNLDFAVYQKKPGKKCPRCGGRDTAEILRGMPAFSNELEKDLEHHRLYLGGCKTGLADPKYHCFDCEKDFGTPPVIYGKKYITEDVVFGRAKLEKYADAVTGIKFTVGGFSEGEETVTVTKNDAGATLKKEVFPCTEEGFTADLTGEEWRKILNKLYGELYLHEWNKSYENLYVLDGTEWSLEITLTRQRKRVISGRNAYPAYWEEFRRFMKKLLQTAKKRHPAE